MELFLAKVWPEILAMIRQCNIRSYSIFHKEGMLFAYFEYHGSDFARDMAAMAADPKTQEWWKVMMPMQVPVSTRAEGEWWATMEEVFHTDYILRFCLFSSHGPGLTAFVGLLFEECLWSPAF